MSAREDGRKKWGTAMAAKRISVDIRQACLDQFEDDVSLVFVEGHDDAILGYVERDGLPTAQLSRTFIGLVRLPRIDMKNVCHGITPRRDSGRLPIRYISVGVLIFRMWGCSKIRFILMPKIRA